MTKEEIQKLRELASKATPGEWAHADAITPRVFLYAIPANKASREDVLMLGETYADGKGQGRRNLAFIAAANPQTVLALLDEIDRYRRAGIEVFQRLLASDDAEQWEMSSILNINNDYPLRKP